MDPNNATNSNGGTSAQAQSNGISSVGSSKDGLPPHMRFSRSASYNNPYEMFPSTSKLFSGFTSLAQNVSTQKMSAPPALAPNFSSPTAVVSLNPNSNSSHGSHMAVLAEEEDSTSGPEGNGKVSLFERRNPSLFYY